MAGDNRSDYRIYNRKKITNYYPMSNELIVNASIIPDNLKIDLIYLTKKYIAWISTSSFLC